MRLFSIFAMLGALVGCDSQDASPPSLQVEPLNGEGIFFINAGDVAPKENSPAWGLPARVLRADPASGAVLQVTLPARWQASEPLAFAHQLEIIVLAGEVSLSGQALGPWDYARFTTGTQAKPETQAGAELLLFFDGVEPMLMDGTPGTPDAVVKAADTPWVGGTAMAEAGRDDVPLKIKHYKNDPDTGARTYLVSVAPGVVIPWERHTVAEEAYIMEGDYTLAECLPGGKVEGTYTAGGYFYRPPGIAHNGPTSGTKTGTVMLIRTPAPLTVELVEGC